MIKPPISRKFVAEAAILFCVFLDLCGFGMVLSDVQLRAQRLMPHGVPTGLVIGLILASTFVVQSLVSPLWGKLADRRGRKPVFLICTILSALAMTVYGLGDRIEFVFASRIVAGFGGANVAMAQAYVAEWFKGPSRTAAFGRIGAAVSAGLIAGPVLGGWMAHRFGSLSMAHVAAGFSFLGVAFGLVALPRDRVIEKVESEKRAGRRRLLSEFPKVRPLFMIAVVAWSSLALLEGTFARLIHALFGYDQLQFGILMGFEATVGFLVQTWLLVLISRRYASRRVLFWGYLLQGVGLALNPVAGIWAALVPPLAVLLVASFLFAIGVSVSNPTVSSLATAIVPEERHGELMGLMQAARSAGFVAGPALGGAFFDWSPSGPYYFAGLICIMAAGLVLWTRAGAAT